MAAVGDRNRLPTLFEVLSRRTLPPVDLFSFYIYMRDQQRSVDYLDFWYVACEEENFILPPPWRGGGGAVFMPSRGGGLGFSLTCLFFQARRRPAHLALPTLCP